MNSGIYKVTNPEGAVYIGKSINFEKRFRCYRAYKSLRQPALHNSLKKYGYENHKIEILMYIPVTAPDSIFNMCEIAYIDYYNRQSVKLLNLTKGGDGCRLVQESIDKMANTLRDKWKDPSYRNSRVPFSKEIRKKMSDGWLTSGRSKPVYQYTKDKELIKKWDKVSDAANHIGDSTGHISRSIKTGGLTRGFIWTREPLCT